MTDGQAVTTETEGEMIMVYFGKVRVMIMDAPRHIVISDNGKRARIFPVVVGAR